MISGRRFWGGPALVLLSPPAELRRDVAQHAVQEVGVVVHTELVRNRQKKCVGGRDRLVLGEIGDQLVRFAGIGLPESGSASVELTDLRCTVSLPR